MSYLESPPYARSLQQDLGAGGASIGDQFEYSGTFVGAEHAYQEVYAFPESNMPAFNTGQRRRSTSDPCQ